jgi:DNA-binding HxlR family transcriptional regulator
MSSVHKFEPKASIPNKPVSDSRAQSDPELDRLVRDIIGKVADKWTMLAIETLHEHGRLRFTKLGDSIGGVSQKMLTKTLRHMEADGLVTRKVFPVIPPRVEYELTGMGMSLGEAFCGVWVWAEKHRDEIQKSRTVFANRSKN